MRRACRGQAGAQTLAPCHSTSTVRQQAGNDPRAPGHAGPNSTGRVSAAQHGWVHAPQCVRHFAPRQPAALFRLGSLCRRTRSTDAHPEHTHMHGATRAAFN